MTENQPSLACDLSEQQVCPLRLRALRWVLILFGVAMIVMFAIALAALFLDYEPMVNETGGIIGKLFAWGDHGQHYGAMIAGIYFTWGWFLVAASRHPTRHGLFIEFTIVANLVHMGLMAVMALKDPAQHFAHLYGDVAIGLTLPVALAIVWGLVRADLRAAATPNNDSATRHKCTA